MEEKTEQRQEWARDFTEFHLLTAVRALAAVCRDAAADLTAEELARLDGALDAVRGLSDMVKDRRNGGAQ
jgi:hypothetical protein